MKRIWILVAGIVSALLVLGTVGCSSGAPAPTASTSNLTVSLDGKQSIKTETLGQVGITVSGTGQVTAVPDLAAIRLGVVAHAKTVAEAQSQATAAMNGVMNALRQGGLADKDIQTSYFNITQLVNYEKDTGKPIIIGYQVSNTVTAKVRDLPKVGDIIDSVAAAGGDLTRINGISFSVEDPTSYQTQAREKAMADAKAKATQMAGLAGITVGRPLQISESSSGLPPPVPIYGAAAPDMAKATPISPGETTITTTVSVVYAIGG